MTCYLGWDVGGWHSDHNSKSRDAIVVLNADGSLAGMIDKNGRDGLAQRFRTTDPSDPDFWAVICRGSGAEDALRACTHLVIAIDAALDFSSEFKALLRGERAESIPPTSADLPYLYRPTERFLSARGFAPLSPIKDMIGSQATKAIHVRLGQTPQMVRSGVWEGSHGARTVTIIEAYPTVARKSQGAVRHLQRLSLADTSVDLVDAAYCAIMAYQFHVHPALLVHPTEGAYDDGWIWVPKDVLGWINLP